MRSSKEICIILWNVVLALIRPKGMRWYMYVPHLIVNVVL